MTSGVPTGPRMGRRLRFARGGVLLMGGAALSGMLLMGGCGGRAAAKAPKESEATARFTDVTAEAGLDFIQSHGGCGKRYFVEQVASGAAFLDADGDGDLDIYFPQPKPLGDCSFPAPLRHRLYMNDGTGKFQLVPDAFEGEDTDYGIAAAVGDYDNDGDADLYVACYGRNRLFRNNGTGTFADVTAKAGVGLPGFSTGATWFDYDGDGHLDLYVGRYCEWSVEKDIPCPGPRGGRDVCSPNIYTAAHHVLYRNRGNGSFEDVTDRVIMGKERRRALGMAAADMDGDGRTDLFVANDLSANFLYKNQPDGTLRDQAMEQNVAFGVSGKAQANMGVAVGDYDEDQDLDVLVTTFANEPYTLYRNDGLYFTDVSGTTGLFKATLPYLGFGTGFLDSRNLGRLDLFFANGHVSPYANERNPNHHYKERNQLLLNDGAGNFADAASALPAENERVHRGACFGDVNNDGRVDILVTANNDRPTLLRNDSAPRNWLMLRLTGANGCATPVGTRCTATIGGRKLLRVLLGGGSYAGESDPRIHFGLGAATKVEQIDIRWPSGKTQTLTDIGANQILDVREGQ